jgi:predicted amidohydrolase
VDTKYAKIGVAICYDIRFPEMVRLMTLKGAEVMVVPAAFNLITGPAHWEISMRVRALDNQIYVAAASPARNEQASYVAYGHSMAVDPWGAVLGSLDEKEGMIVTAIDPARLAEVRKELPLLQHRRTDMYGIKDLT